MLDVDLINLRQICAPAVSGVEVRMPRTEAF